HAHVVLLVHTVAVDGRAHELVNAETDLFVLARPIGAKSAVARRPRLRIVRRLEQPDTLHDRPEAIGVVTVEHQRRDAEMAGRLIRRIVPLVASRLSGECREQRPRLSFVAALEDAGRFDADQQAAVADGKCRDLRDLSIALGVVRDPLARVGPRLTQVEAPPDGLTVPFARGRSEDRVGLRVVNHVVDGPALAERAAKLPRLPVVAFEEKSALARPNQQPLSWHRARTSRSEPLAYLSDRRGSRKSSVVSLLFSKGELYLSLAGTARTKRERGMSTQESVVLKRVGHVNLLEPNPVLVQHAVKRAESAQNRIADRITAFAGSMAFVYIHIVWFGCWIGFGVEHYPYGLLTMIVSLEAIFLSTFVMISQNRADAKRQIIADQQWQTVKEEDSQNEELLELSRQILQLTKEVHAYAATRTTGAPEVRG